MAPHYRSGVLRTSGARPVDVNERALLRMSRGQLDRLFASGLCGPIPNGRAHGTAIMLPGTVFNSSIARLVNAVAWKGKTFDAIGGSLTNCISPFAFNAIAAVVFQDSSWFDREPCIVLDYSKTSVIARSIRDEIRLMAPGFYLGKVYWRGFPTFAFCLRFIE